MSKYFTVDEVARLLEVSPSKVRWLIIIGRLKAKLKRDFRFTIRGSYVVDFVYNNPKYDKALADKFGWHISEYRSMRERLEWRTNAKK